MQAGRGAEEQAQLIAVRLERDRALPGADPEKIAAAKARQRAWASGAEGERATALHLADLEAAYGRRVLHDVRWPGRPKANIDHIAVGPGGVVVVDSKNWSEPARPGKGTLWRGRYPARKEADEVLRMVAAVAALVPAEQRRHVSGALCVVQQDLPPTVLDGGVVAVGGVHLAAWLRGRAPVIDPGAVEGLSRSRAGLLDGRPGRALVTTADVDRPWSVPRSVPRSGASGPRPSSARPPSSARRPAAGTASRGRARRSGRRGLRTLLAKLAFLGLLAVMAPTWAPLAHQGLTEVLVDQLLDTPTAPAPTVQPPAVP